MEKIILLTCFAFVLCAAVNAQSKCPAGAVQTLQQCVETAETAKKTAEKADPTVQAREAAREAKKTEREQKEQAKKAAAEACFADNGCPLDAIKAKMAAKIAAFNKTRECKEAIGTQFEQQVGKCYQAETGQALPEEHKKHGEKGRKHGGKEGKGDFGHEEGHPGFEADHQKEGEGKGNQESSKQNWVDIIAKSPACNATANPQANAAKVAQCLEQLHNASKPAAEAEAAKPAHPAEAAAAAQPAFVQAFCSAKSQCFASFNASGCTMKDVKEARKISFETVKNCSKEVGENINKTGGFAAFANSVSQCAGIDLTKHQEDKEGHKGGKEEGKEGEKKEGEKKEGEKKEGEKKEGEKKEGGHKEEEDEDDICSPKKEGEGKGKEHH